MNAVSFVRSASALAAGTLLALGAPPAASAHVTIDPGNATAGSYTVITVKVPNESETAATNRVELTLPAETPFASVRYVPVPGWTAELVTETLPDPVMVGDREVVDAVTSVIWTADAGSEIQAGQLQLFPLSVGPVPDTGSIVMPADQTYTDGEVVSWSEAGEDAEHPAPVLYVNDAATDEAAPIAITAAAAPADDVLARALGIGGLVVGGVGIVLAASTRRKTAD